jgi:hydroxymethylglutaryl-CoA reductase
LKSDLAQLYKLSVEKRRQLVIENSRLDIDQQLALLGEDLPLIDCADRMIENAVGLMGVPLGICTYLRINGHDRLVPMATEEPSVVAAASNAAKLLRQGGGIYAKAEPSVMIGQIQIVDVPDLGAAQTAIMEAQATILGELHSLFPLWQKRGGGPRALEVRLLPPVDDTDHLDTMMIVHLLIDVCDAMGANAVNSMCEAIAPRLAELSKGRINLRILSNLCDQRLVSATTSLSVDLLHPPAQSSLNAIEIAQAIEEASVFAERDPYRAATHNKGIMNGIDAVLLATAQDYRAAEAGVHAYAARTGRYTALSRWRVRDGILHGDMTLPLAVGTVGGAVHTHPTAQAALALMRVKHACELAEIAAAVGLAQNFAALRALTTHGIQSGHIRLHAHNIAAQVSNSPTEIEYLTQNMLQHGRVSHSYARELRDNMPNKMQ